MCKPEITHPLLLSLSQPIQQVAINDRLVFSPRNLSKRATSAVSLTRFYCNNMAATCLACTFDASFYFFYLHHATASTRSYPPLSLSHSQLIPTPAASPSPLPLRLVEQHSRWVFSSCYDLRDDNGSYNVASRSWCGWACGGLCCVKAGDSAREGEEETEAGHGLSANHSAGSTSVSSAVFSLPLLLSCFLSLHPLTSASLVVLQW